jgi:CheY-like chemotaxis protein
VLDFASIEAGRVELRPGPFAPAELLRSVATTLKTDAAARGATLTVEAYPNLPAILLGDAGRIQQILVNYVSNALKYAGGPIVLSARVPPGSPDEVEFAVTDAGAGLTPAEQAVLFTKFTRSPGARRDDIAGAGLGLAACRLLADIMDGSVGVQSKPGRGSRFFLRLPLAVTEAPVAVANIPLPNATVLVVEDADYNAMAAAAVLSKLGLANERARTGREALQLFAGKRFNVVLLDRNLPDMDGTEVARRMRELEADGPRAVLLAVTAYCTEEDRALCLAAGMDAFVGKPLTPEKLRKVLLAAGRRLLTAASVHVSADAPAEGLDLSLLSYLSDGTDSGLGDQVERFLAALAGAEAQLFQTARAGDFSALGDAAHFVLSQARLIGGAALEAASLRLERAARAHDPAAGGDLLQLVHREIEAVTAVLRRRDRAKQPV